MRKSLVDSKIFGIGRPRESANSADKKNPLWRAVSKDAVSVSGFTGFVWMEGRFA